MEKTICFTGHRKLGGDWNYNWGPILEHLIHIIKRAYNNGFNTFISGGAIGTDLTAAGAVLNCRDREDINIPIKLIIAKPFVGQEKTWPKNQKTLYNMICNNANEVIIVSEGGYSPAKMELRNRWMVDHSNVIIGILDPCIIHGGTVNCLHYAWKQKKPLLTINPYTFKEEWILPK